LEDVVGILFNPVYSYGKLLLPSEIVVAHVFRLNEELAERQKSQGRAFTLEELDEEYTALMDRLVAQGLCWHEQDVPAVISKEEWLQTQQTAIERLAEGEDILWGRSDELISGGQMPGFDEDTDEEWGWYDGQCYACR
jgi:hypothetical protein